MTVTSTPTGAWPAAARIATVRIPPPVGEQELSTRRFPDDALVVVLDGIEDPQNLGAAARSAEAAGAALLVTRRARAADAGARPRRRGPPRA
ncbi:MAG: TrmH family RNA methyltransferase [Actinomycetota bacterium]